MRLALLKEGADALLRVEGEKRGRKALLLGLDPLVEIALVGGLLYLLDRDRGCLGEPARERQRLVEELVVGDHAVYEPVLERVVGGDRIADQVHLQRLVLPDQARQPLGAAEAGDDPELYLRLAED